MENVRQTSSPTPFAHTIDTVRSPSYTHVLPSNYQLYARKTCQSHVFIKVFYIDIQQDKGILYDLIVVPATVSEVKTR